MPSREIEGQRAEVGKQSRPSTGGYYWLPTPGRTVPDWDVISCHDLGLDCGIGHSEIWPAVIPRLATIWGRDPKAMKRRLGRHCYGLPRGRVTRSGEVYLILHGADSPIPHWTEAVVQAFRLQGRRVRPLFDEHEQRLSGDIRALARVLGSFLAHSDFGPTQRDPGSREGRSAGTPGDGIGPGVDPSPSVPHAATG